MKLRGSSIRGIDHSPARRAIVAGVVSMCAQLAIDVIAEGIETRDEAQCLSDLGIRLMQGYLFAKPAFRAAATVDALALDVQPR